MIILQIGLSVGHVGWAYQVVGTLNWTAGATENGPSLLNPTQSIVRWYANAPFNDIMIAFKESLTYDGIIIHPLPYYTRYRCITTPFASPAAAWTAVGYEVPPTYNALTDNCLTKSITIFQAYSDSLAGLDPGLTTGPNFYFTNLLTGFGAIQEL
jgi:hypothetical protein